MQIIKYPDGSSYVKEPNCVIPHQIFKINTYEDLWNLNQYVDVCNHSGYTPTIVIPNLIDAQADRRFNDDESSGLKLVCQFLNNMNADFQIFHPHNSEVVEALINNVTILDNQKFIREVLQNLVNNGSKDLETNLVLMASDAGGFKPLMKLCDKLDWKGVVHSCSKNRYYADGKSHLNQICSVTDFDGRDILIIDDICVYGGTFKGLSKLFKERNCGKLYLAVSHMTVQILGEDPVTNYFDKVFTTNSKYDNYYIGPKTGYTDAPKNLEIIKLF
jgi:ribose-phosphate pyrophosphokinase